MGDVAAKEGRTVLFVSHNMAAVQSLCHKGLWLNEGNIVKFSRTEEVVSGYLEMGRIYQLEKEWKNQESAPGNHEVRLHYIKLMTRDGSSEITIDSPLNLIVEFWNFFEHSQLNLSVNLFDSREVLVFNSFSEPKIFSKGLVKIVGQIPQNLLNDEIYKIEIMIVKNFQIVLAYKDALVFEVGERERGASWLGKWSGVVRPILQWESSLIETI
jgi:lipopolysaccharide transport system ATP-binding protein